MKLLSRLGLVVVLLIIITPVFAHVVVIPASPQAKDAGVPPDVIEANAEPNVEQVVAADESVYNRAYRRVLGSFQLFGSSAGDLVADWGKGFNYVTAGQKENGYAYIGGNRWVSEAQLSSNVQVSRFAGVLLPEEPLQFTAAWILQKVRPSAFPGEPESPSNPLLERYTRVNLFTYVEIDGFRWYQVADGQWVHQFNVAKIVPIDRPEGINSQKWVSVDLYEQTLIAYDGEKPVFATLVASGLPQWSTPEGLFHVYLRVDRVVMTGAEGQADFYYLQDVPWNMFFSEDVALHGTYWHDGFGYRHSHGCVNLSLADANWLYGWSADQHPDDRSEGLGVYVYSSGTYE